MNVPWRTKVAAAVAGACLALAAPQATAAPGGDGGHVTAEAPAAAPQDLPCGFGFWTQSYRNCTGDNILVVAPAHESVSNKWFQFEHCLAPGESKQTLAPWGWWVFLATHVDVPSC